MNEKMMYMLGVICHSIIRYVPGDFNSIQFFHFGKKEWMPDTNGTHYGLYMGFDDSEVITEEEANSLINYFLSGNNFRRGENWRELISKNGDE